MGGLNTGLLQDIVGQNNVAPQVENPLGSYQKILDIKQAQQNLQQNAAFAPVRQQIAETQAESQRMDLQSRKSYLDAITQADGDPDKLTTALANAPLSPEHRAIADKQIADTKQSLAKATQDQIAASQANKKQIAQVLFGLSNSSSDQQLPVWQSAVDQISAIDPVTKKPYLPSGTLNRDAVPDMETVKTLGRLASLGGWQESEANAIKAKRDAAEAAKDDLQVQSEQLTADAKKLAGAARLGPAQLKATIDSLPLERQGPFAGITDPNEILRVALKPEDALKLPAARTAAQWGDYVSSVIDKAKYPALSDMLTKQVQFAMQSGGAAAQEEATKAVDKAVQNVAEIEKEKDPVLRQQKLDAAVAQAKALTPIILERANDRARATSDAGGLTADDYSRAGEEYARTGVMPSLGRDSVTRARIVKAANSWEKDNGLSPAETVAMRAAYQGDKDSLKNFQKQRDQIVSFENTAQKNLDQFLTLADQIPDTGVPWLNKPIRSLDSNIVGSANMAAVNAARQVANNEIAKVTSGGGLSGVLSDSARHEIAAYNPDNATFAQTKAVAKVLKQDMANRHQSMDATLDDIKSRIGATARVNSAAPAQVPTAVKALLSNPGVTTGIHKLSDGTSWIKDASGNITSATQ